MRKYDEICKEVGYPPKEELKDTPERWAAYKGGEVKFFDTADEARAFSKNIEEVDKAKYRKEYYEQLRQLERIAIAMFNQELRAEHSDLTDEQYEIVYNLAYANSGDRYDDLVATMDEFALAAYKLMATVKRVPK